MCGACGYGTHACDGLHQHPCPHTHVHSLWLSSTPHSPQRPSPPLLLCTAAAIALAMAVAVAVAVAVQGYRHRVETTALKHTEVQVMRAPEALLAVVAAVEMHMHTHMHPHPHPHPRRHTAAALGLYNGAPMAPPRKFIE